MTLNSVKLGRPVTFMKCLASIVSLILPPKTLIFKKFLLPASDSLNIAELVVNELINSISKNFTNILFSVRFISASCKDFKSL